MHILWKYLFDEDTGRGIALTTLFYHSTYKKTYQFAKQVETWSSEQMQEYQWNQLSTLLQHAYDHVPYYNNLLKTFNMTPGDIKTLEDFRRIPLLGKETIQGHANEFKATNYPPSAFEETNTGGSTGFSLQFSIEKGVWFAKHLAYLSILLNRGGCDVMDNSVQLVGREKPWEYRPLSRTLVLSSYQMTEQNLPIYVKKIIQLHPGYFIGYPSAMTMLASYMKQHSLEIKGVKAIHLFGETIYDWQREFLESFFHCRVHGQYGHREQCVLSGTCEKANTYHIFPDYGYVELVDRNGQPVTKEGQIGEIVATGFHTGIFPFIRYKTGDIAVYTSERCECGRQVPLLKSVEGRIQDFMVSGTGRLVPLMGVLQLISRSSSHMKEYQLYQDHEGELVLHIVKKEGFSDEDVNQIRENIRTRLGDEFSLSIDYLDSIPRTIRGKYQFFVQKLPVKYIL
ncbi:MAG TPA: phenylacetate--CoA ligase family protein [Thermoplasmata archaeon]|nr:phenylacetate--CoA ligase family protein [Thermoplasmata archaeon]